MSKRKTTASTGDGKKLRGRLRQAPDTQPVPTGPVGQPGRAPQRRAQSHDRREAHAGDAGQGERGRPHAHKINAGRRPSWCCARRRSKAMRARSIACSSWQLRFNNEPRSDRPRRCSPMTKPSSLPIVAECRGRRNDVRHTANPPTIRPRNPAPAQARRPSNERSRRPCRAATQRPALLSSGRASRPYCRAHPICRTGISTPSSTS